VNIISLIAKRNTSKIGKKYVPWIFGDDQRQQGDWQDTQGVKVILNESFMIDFMTSISMPHTIFDDMALYLSFDQGHRTIFIME
jgi:hypothetical protein